MKTIRVTTFVLGLIFPFVLHATDGHQLIGIGAVQKSLGGAGVAQGLDSTWVLLNPAAIHGLERRFDLSWEVFAPTRSMTPKGPDLPMLGGRPFANAAGTSEDDSIFHIPTIGLLLPREAYTIGFGFYGVNGMGVDYAHPRSTIPASRGEDFDRVTEYAVGKLAGAVAWDFAEHWRLGVQSSLNISRFRSDMLTASFEAPRNEKDWDTRFGAGFQLGLIRDTAWGSIGASYISRQWMQSFSQYDDLFRQSMDLPPMLQAGIAWNLTPRTTWYIDGKWIGWSEVDQIGQSPDRGGFGWEDQYVLKTGIALQLSDPLTLRGGFSQGNSPIGEDEVFANALFPAITETHITLGIGYRINPSLEVNFTYMHAFENRLTQSASGSQASTVGVGTEISLEENSFSLQLSGRF